MQQDDVTLDGRIDSLRPLAGQVVLLTRADEGVGMATAAALAGCGANLALTLLDTEVEPALLDELRRIGCKVVVFKAPTDSSSTQHTQLVRQVMAEFGKIDVLVANSEYRVQWQVDDDDLDEDQVEFQYSLNVKSNIALIRAVIRVMTDGGRVIALGSSLADRVGTPGLADFAATRAALAAFCKGAAHDLGPRGISINVVQMGAIAFDAVAVSPDIMESERASTALKRLGKPSEVASAITFLAGPTASFITGSVLNVDGGYNA
ncbi:MULTISPECIES: SDR family NAD(P)-dependent oxidoreductase [Rhizobium]|jgi:NAD(P)-dependent dehydrogenase (short-subunit alcohol dehydrogenase family)|uniref:SDR family oxidoreductase n=1 Tax=Rhizobium ruizarguesonis TaxID=2081791 RepID=A0AAE8U299_9HYPH|nr:MULTISPECIES: SDR family oxidoreductase [Rhizobium]NEH82980.1 SDR family oxidoreductase [Rhizobium ruizarguesonis]TAY13814.1 SDR family oxidoreductase [Rhizobium leguminosarum]TBD09873.1 SDR family oxidoreductase [Rhizobium ruizarguesonis]TBF18952.1 SDR family oxidoreductase [Rhizobium ruizarguesonis]TBF40527.1 SDR family oxidoreductase [Rhizobium leguminosarum]